MKHYTKKKIWKLLILIGAILIGSFSLIYTKILTDQLKEEEKKKVELWAEAMEQFVKMDINETSSSTLMIKVITDNTTIPILIVDDQENIKDYRNIGKIPKDTTRYLQQQFISMKEDGDSIYIDLGDHQHQLLYYKTSTLLQQLSAFPILQLIVVFIFMLIAYLAFSISRKAEQDQVWVGMAKETAHQLGTPITSLMGWIDFLELKNKDGDALKEIRKDVERLENVADRFSKIGSNAKLKNINLYQSINKTTQYLKNRSSHKVIFKVSVSKDLTIYANNILFEWVVENLTKNAIDAILGDGSIEISANQNEGKITIDIKDNGKGISKKHLKTVFKPGYTTKKRGWGLGLSLSKRIIEVYHHGKIFVKVSEVNEGTTFRIILKAAE